jgi:putative ABC transport system permease protein
MAGAAGAGATTLSSASTTTITVTPAITPEILLFAVGLATLVGILGGLIPAWRASRLAPVEALRRS